MSNNTTSSPVPTENFKVKSIDALKDGVYRVNPLTIQVLGICSLLAVTNRVENSVVMSLALIFVLVMSNFLVSVLRFYIPKRIRMVAMVAIIATFVIIFDQFLKGFYFDISKQLGPYVGLIITNCIVMGRAEAYAMSNPPIISAIDGFANGIGYAWVLIVVGIFREIVGSGTISAFGFTLPSLTQIGYQQNLLFVLAPGAFITVGLLIWVINSFKLRASEA